MGEGAALLENPSTDALIQELARRIGPEFDIVIHRRPGLGVAAVGQPGDPVRMCAVRMVDFVGVPVNLVGHRCLVECLVIMSATWPKRQKMQAVMAEVARRCCGKPTWGAADRAIRHGLARALETDPDQVAAALGLGTRITVTACVQRLLPMMIDAVALGAERG